MSKRNWKKLGWVFGLWAMLITGFSLASPFGIAFWIVFPILISIPAGFFSYLVISDEPDADSDDVLELRAALATYEAELEENYVVINEYEQIFDAQLIELPCVCGGNTFKGLFSPKLENIVECEKCNSNYRVTVAYDSVLLSEPMNQKASTLDVEVPQ